MKRTIISLLAFWWAGSLRAGEPSLSYVDLIHRLTDLEYLAQLPASGDQCAQWSSYDRKSRYESTTGKYVNWDANGDGDGVIRKEGDKLILAEMQGPGCIWRMWSAEPRQGHVRIYLDGATEAAVDLPFIGYFDRKNAPFTRAAIVHTVARGWNNYTPIPYQKSCKIVADPGWGLYYHFGYETFPAGTRVPSFKRQLGSQEEQALDQADQVLSTCGPMLIQPSWKEVQGEWVLGGNASRSVNLDGPAAIMGLQIKTELPAPPAQLEALRGLVVQIRWDGEAQPSVWAPLGDFFGTAPGLNPYRSLPLGLTEDGWWYCNWFMPFGKSAEITFKNESAAPAKIQYRIGSKRVATSLSGLGRFHAKWHRDAFLPQEPERWIDWPVLKTEGTGRFVGVMLHIWNPRGGWWGEGDEKFFVDGEKFPSTFGTGSEDYFGYAWSSGTVFQQAYHNQTHNDRNSRGHISVNRWHIADNVPFHTAFEGDIEKYYLNERPTLYGAMAYWYLAAGGKDPYPAVPLSERTGYWTPVESAKVKGAIEGESLTILSKTAGNPQEQDLTGFQGQWSNDAHLWWIDAKPGDKLELGVPVAVAGNYQLTLQLTKAPDYGIVQLYLDGKKLGETIDLYHSSVIPTGSLAMGSHELGAGQHKLMVEIVGANEKAVKSYMFGLDYLKLEAAP